jgi:hypothetical protein
MMDTRHACNARKTEFRKKREQGLVEKSYKTSSELVRERERERERETMSNA